MVKLTKNKIVYEQNINNINGKVLAIVFPDSIEELKNLVKLSEEDLVPRGSGTSFTGGVIPKNSVVIDFSNMNKIFEINTSKKTVTLEPGVLLSDLNNELERYDLELPVLPIFAGIETIGGMIAKNSTGNREIKYGRMLNWVDSLQVINGKGELIKVSKSDISDFVGMEGTTGLIIEATLRVTNKKKRSLTILRANTLEDVFVANRKLRLKQDICSIDLVNKEISVLLGLENRYHIFVETENDEGSFKNEEMERFIKIKNRAYKKIATEGFVYMTNVKFLIDSLQDFLLYLEQKKIPYISHMASGVIYPFFRPEQILMLEEVNKFAKRLRGRIAYNFGIGLTKKDCLEPGEAEIIKRVKNRHDPQGKFNRDKLIDYKSLKKSDKISELAEQIKEEKEQTVGQILEEQKAEELKNALEEMQQTPDIQKTIKRPEPELSAEEKEKIKKIASGFFGGVKKD